MPNGKLSDIEHDLEELWSKYAVQPQYAQTSLKNFRKLCAEHGAADYTVDFLVEVRDVPEAAIVVMTPGHLSLLVDSRGALLEFA